ncbi:MAG: hypothetical protein HQK55_03005 [Deltaproteobacteria bacterium]|nr:hypothetical protein [Deltaproteobacteria bacterium]
MTVIDLIKDSLDVRVEPWTETPVRPKSIALETATVESQTISTQTRSEEMQTSPLPKIRGLDFLKEGIYGLDLEKTIEDMFMVIKKMEAQLERVLNINSLLEKDLQYAKDRIRELKAEKAFLEDTIAGLQEEIPTKREMQIEIDHVLGERHSAEKRIREMEKLNQDANQKTIRYQARIAELEEERRDTMSEINYLEARLNSATEKIARQDRTINLTRGELIAHKDRVKSLEEELNSALNDKFRALKALKESNSAVAELHSALAEKELQLKKAFYRGEEEKREGV